VRSTRLDEVDGDAHRGMFLGANGRAHIFVHCDHFGRRDHGEALVIGGAMAP
jgi:hypothetical protein